MQAYFQQTQIKFKERQSFPADDLAANSEKSQVRADDIQTKFEQSCADYVSILEEIADALKTLDDDLLHNVLGKEQYESYKKKQIERQVVMIYLILVGARKINCIR